MKNIILLFWVMFVPILMQAQQDPIFTTYTFNTLLYNPAYAGSHGNWDINATYRRQWTGIDGSPSTILVGAEGALKRYQIGLGATVYSDDIGIENRTDISTNYAYILPTSGGSFSIGLKVGLASHSLDFGELAIKDPNDPVYAGEDKPTTLYFGPGLMYQNDVFYAGVSSPNLAKAELKKNDATEEVVKRHFYFHAGSWIDIGSSGMQFRPSLLLSMEEAAPIQFHLNAGFLFTEYLGAGVSYRSGDAFNVHAIVYPTDRLRIGFGYDFTISDLKDYSDATFEIMTGYSFGEQVTKISNPR